MLRKAIFTFDDFLEAPCQNREAQYRARHRVRLFSVILFLSVLSCTESTIDLWNLTGTVTDMSGRRFLSNRYPNPDKRTAESRHRIHGHWLYSFVTSIPGEYRLGG